MDKLKTTFAESELFKFIANYPDALSDTVAESAGLNPEQAEIVRSAMLEMGFHLTNAASASYRLTHAVDMMRIHGNIGPEIRFIIMEASSELTNAVTLNEPINKVRELLEKLGEDFDNWDTDVPEVIADDGIDVIYVRNYKDLVPGKLVNFRYKGMENETIITDIPCIYDTDLMAYLPLTINPVWKYVDATEDTQTDNEGSGLVTGTAAQEG